MKKFFLLCILGVIFYNNSYGMLTKAGKSILGTIKNSAISRRDYQDWPEDDCKCPFFKEIGKDSIENFVSDVTGQPMFKIISDCGGNFEELRKAINEQYSEEFSEKGRFLLASVNLQYTQELLYQSKEKMECLEDVSLGCVTSGKDLIYSEDKVVFFVEELDEFLDKAKSAMGAIQENVDENVWEDIELILNKGQDKDQIEKNQNGQIELLISLMIELHEENQLANQKEEDDM